MSGDDKIGCAFFFIIAAVVAFVIYILDDSNHEINTERYLKIERLVQENPEVKPFVDEKLADGKITIAEEKEIVKEISRLTHESVVKRLKDGNPPVVKPAEKPEQSF